jgi:outer membrane cobalamin receptor
MKPTSLLVAAVLLPFASTLVAQQRDSTRSDTTAHELPPIEVVGSIQPAAGPTIGSGVPARVTRLSAEDVDAYEPRVLSDAIKTVAGFSTYDDLGSPYKLNISSRGFYSSPVVGLPQGIAIFLDGVRMNEPEASQVNFDLLPMDHISRIEVLSGNGSLLGRNALGGAVNLVTTGRRREHSSCRAGATEPPAAKDTSPVRREAARIGTSAGTTTARMAGAREPARSSIRGSSISESSGPPAAYGSRDSIRARTYAPRGRCRSPSSRRAPIRT